MSAKFRDRKALIMEIPYLFWFFAWIHQDLVEDRLLYINKVDLIATSVIFLLPKIAYWVISGAYPPYLPSSHS